jgi:DNA (cytosine-5)-methyltransferase 1
MRHRDLTQLSFSELLSPNLETFEETHFSWRRHVGDVSSDVPKTLKPPHPGTSEDAFRGGSLKDIYDLEWLRSAVPPSTPDQRRGEVNVVDLFCGCGGLSLGISEASRAVGLRAIHKLGIDADDEFLDVYRQNIRPEYAISANVRDYLDGELGARPTKNELVLVNQTGAVDVLLGGPPCQGHSDLNNYTRRHDKRNSLFLVMARAAEVLRPKAVMVENVPGVRHDKSNVLGQTVDALKFCGYSVEVANVDAADFGVPQRRKRTFIIATLDTTPNSLSIDDHLNQLMVPQHRSVSWALKDLESTSGYGLFDAPSKLTRESQQRVDWLFNEGVYELPDEFRPDCHKLKQHSYRSVYGRLIPEKPSGTITTGFLVMGQGRFLHPTQRRTLTPHEGARLQFFPDWFDFGERKRKTYAKLIGNAVPTKLGYVMGLYILRKSVLHGR